MLPDWSKTPNHQDLRRGEIPHNLLGDSVDRLFIVVDHGPRGAEGTLGRFRSAFAHGRAPYRACHQGLTEGQRRILGHHLLVQRGIGQLGRAGGCRIGARRPTSRNSIPWRRRSISSSEATSSSSSITEVSTINVGSTCVDDFRNQPEPQSHERRGMGPTWSKRRNRQRGHCVCKRGSNPARDAVVATPVQLRCPITGRESG